MRWMASSMARRSLESVCFRARRTCRSLSWLDWSIQSPLFDPGSAAGVRTGVAASNSSLFFSRRSLYFFTFEELMSCLLLLGRTQLRLNKQKILTPRPELCKDKVLYGDNIVLK